MAQPLERPPPALNRLVSEAEELRERLRRVAIALSITEEMMAEAFERTASAGGDGAPEYRKRAVLARRTADVCRSCAQRVDELHEHV
jgi:hypothetical protein